jgi:uncharacterized protein (TIGR00290 family)
MQHKTYFNWSGGKDSALALYYTLQNKEYNVQRLLTSVNDSFNRISMHGVRTELLQLQANALNIPLQQLRLPEQPTMEEYNTAMFNTVKGLYEEGFMHTVFGDIFLEDLRKYREEKLAEQNIKAYFPLWKRDTTELIHEFIDIGFKTIVVCTKAEMLDKSFAGRVIDKDFLKDLPKNVDPCGENGEFHTFVFDGPVFKTPVAFNIGETIFREYQAPKNKEDNCFSNNQPTAQQMGFWFCDLTLA